MSSAIVSYQRRASGNAEYEEIIAEVSDRYDQALELLGRSHAALYAFLGCIHQAAARIDVDPTLRFLLVTEVGRIVDEGREGKRRWDVAEYETAKLLLLLKTSANPEFTSLRCKWVRALRAAAMPTCGPVPPTEDEFVGWIEDKGVKGAAELAKVPEVFNLLEFDPGLADASSAFEITVPEYLDLSGDYVIILAKVLSRDRRRAKVNQVELFDDDKRVKNLCSAAVRRWNKQQEEHQAEIDKEQRAMARAYYKADAGDPGAPGSIRPEDVDRKFETAWHRDKNSGLAGNIRPRR